MLAKASLLKTQPHLDVKLLIYLHFEQGCYFNDNDFAEDWYYNVNNFEEESYFNDGQRANETPDA